MTSLLLTLFLSTASPAAVPDNVITGNVANAAWHQEKWEQTERQLDWYVSGAGLFPLEGPDGKVYLTRYGRFALDKNEDIVHEASGLRLLAADTDGALKPLSLRGRAHKPFVGGRPELATLGGLSLNDDDELVLFYSDGTNVSLGHPSLAIVHNMRKLRVVDAGKHLLALTPEAEPAAFVPPSSESAGHLLPRTIAVLEPESYAKYLPGR